MFNLPKSTEVNSRIPKQNFYENINLNPKIKEDFKNQIKTIYLRNKISKETTNLGKRDKVEEILLFEIKLNTETISDEVLKIIDKSIPYHTIFIFNYNDTIKCTVAFKEIDNYRVTSVAKYYSSPWENEDKDIISLSGLDLDTVYENFIKQIAGENLEIKEEKDLKIQLELQNKIDNLKKEIEKLESKIRKEKQFNKQCELNSKCRLLKKELEEIYNGEDEDGDS